MDQISVQFLAHSPRTREWGFSVTELLQFNSGIFDLGANGWITPDGTTLMTKPLQLMADRYPWVSDQTIPTELTRQTLSDFISLDGATWQEVCPRGVAGDRFLAAPGAAHSIETGVVYPDNQGFWLAVQCVGPRGGNQIIAKVTFAKRAKAVWDDGQQCWSYAAGGDLSLTIYSNGLAEVREGDQLLSTGWLSGSRKDYAGQLLQVMILPYRRNSILFLEAGGGYWVWRDPELPIDFSAKTTTMARAVQLEFPETKGIFQLLPIKYPVMNPVVDGSWLAKTQGPVKMPYAPNSESWAVSEPDWMGTDWDSPTGTEIFIWDCDQNGNDCSYDGQNTDLHVRIACKTTNTETPMFYKVALNYPVVLESTTALEGDVTAWVKAESLRLSLPLDPSQRTCSFTLRNASSLGVDPNTLHNRLVSVQIDGNEIFRGTVMPPIIRRIQGGVDVVEFTLHDQWHRFSHTILPNSRAYDGWDATEAIGDLLEKAGLQVRDGGDFNFQSGSEGGQSLETGEVYLVKGTGKLAQSRRDEQDLYRPQMGSSVAEVLTHIKENHFAHDWIHGFRPVYTNGVSSVKYCLYPKPSEPMAVLYIDRLSASANFSDFVAMGEWVETHSEPEANELWVIGQDPDGYAIVASQFNAFSQLPSYSDAISAGLLPGLWLGERRLILRFDNSLNTQADTDFVCGLLWNAAFREKTRARVKATYRPSINDQTIDLQPGDVIEIQGKQGLWRILSMEIDLDYIRPGNSIAFCEYEIELVSGDSMQEEQQE